jgi:hypothetical protein
MTMMLPSLSSSTMSGMRFLAISIALISSASAFQSCTHNPSRLGGCVQEHRPSAFISQTSYHARPAASLTPRTTSTSSTRRSMMLNEIISEASTWIAEVPISSEPIHTAFTVATFLPQPFWLLIILLPNTAITKKIMGGLGT